MEFESKILSKGISEMLYNSEKSLGTAESCTGGRIAEAIIAVPGVLEEQTAVCEEVARQMVLGAIRALHVDYAISATGVAGPTGGTPGIPVGTIWLAYGSKDDVRTVKLEKDYGRDINLAIATNTALKSMYAFLKEHEADLKHEQEKAAEE